MSGTQAWRCRAMDVHVIRSYGFEFVHASVVYWRTHRHKQSYHARAGARIVIGVDAASRSRTQAACPCACGASGCVCFISVDDIDHSCGKTHVFVLVVEKVVASRLQYVCELVGIAFISELMHSRI